MPNTKSSPINYASSISAAKSSNPISNLLYTGGVSGSVAAGYVDGGSGGGAVKLSSMFGYPW